MALNPFIGVVCLTGGVASDVIPWIVHILLRLGSRIPSRSKKCQPLLRANVRQLKGCCKAPLLPFYLVHVMLVEKQSVDNFVIESGCSVCLSWLQHQKWGVVWRRRDLCK